MNNYHHQNRMASPVRSQTKRKPSYTLNLALPAFISGIHVKKSLLFSVILLGIFIRQDIFAQSGIHDVNFNPGTVFDKSVFASAMQSDGKILVGGDFTTINGTPRNMIARLNNDGSLDTSFDPGKGSDSYIYALALQEDGKILVGGFFSTFNGTASNGIVRLNSDGSLDTGFNPGTGFDGYLYALSLQADGKILAGGVFNAFNGTTRNRVARLNNDGSLDTSFHPDLRYETGNDNSVFALAIQKDGKILIAGKFCTHSRRARNRVVRLNSDGSLDTGFNPEIKFDNDIYAIALQMDGKILVGGKFSAFKKTERNRIARLNSDGSLDMDFNPGTGFNNTVNAFTQQPDGKILVGGDFSTFNDTSKNRIIRLNREVVSPVN